MSLLSTRTHYKPFDYPWAFTYFKRMRDMAWEPHEVPLQEDVRDWQTKLTPKERNLLTQIFRFFTQADGDILTGYCDRYLPVFRKHELRMMLVAFADAEANHMHAYSQLLDTVGMPEVEYQAFHDYAVMQAKHDYLFQERMKGRSDVEKLALDLAVFSAFGEGMQLFASFAILMSFKARNLMKGMGTIIEWSIRDESLHVEAMTKLFHTLIRENPKVWTDDLRAIIYQTCRDMVALEDGFIDLAFEMGDLEGITAEKTKQYIRYIADRRLLQLGLKANYGVNENPFDWLDWMMNAHTHANFFETRSTEYSKGGVKNWENAYDWLSAREEQLELFEDVLSGNKLVLYTKEGCPYCSLLKAELLQRRISFETVDLSDDNVRQLFYTRTGTDSMPQLFVADGPVSLTNPTGRRLGGWDSVSKLLS